MNCQQWDETMMRYFDRLSNDIETAALKQHIKQCARCAEQFNQLNDILGSLEQAEEINLPKEFEKDVMSKINAYAFCRHEESRKSQTTLVIGIMSVLSVPVVVLGMVFSNLSPFQMILDIGNHISNLSNLWAIASILIRSSSIFLAGLDFLLIKTILATAIIYLSLAILSKAQLSKHKMGLN